MMTPKCIKNLPANLKNFCVSGGKLLECEFCDPNLAKDVTLAPGDKGLGGGISNEDIEAASFFSNGLSTFSLSDPWTKKNASTAGCKTNTALVSVVSANSVNASPEIKRMTKRNSSMVSSNYQIKSEV